MAFALVDDPDHQVRHPSGLRLGGGHLAIGGSQRSGRSTALRSAACALAKSVSAADAHLYVFDFAGGALRPLIGLPHCGGSTFGDWEQAGRMVRSLNGLVATRLADFAEKGFSGIADQRSSGEAPLPHLVVLVDGWEVVAEEGSNFKLNEQLLNLLSRGQSVGITALVAGDRNVLLGRMGRSVSTRYALGFNDASEYVAVGLAAKAVPTRRPTGRALVVPTGELVQFALVPDPDGRGQPGATSRAVGEIAVADSSPVDRRPVVIAPLPRSIRFAEVLARGAAPCQRSASGDRRSVRRQQPGPLLRPWASALHGIRHWQPGIGANHRALRHGSLTCAVPSSLRRRHSG